MITTLGVDKNSLKNPCVIVSNFVMNRQGVPRRLNRDSWPSSWKGVLAQVKNRDEQFWKEKFHAANGKAQHALINCPMFSL
jgi:hypothetical protein